jgi:hypothetical protein
MVTLVTQLMTAMRGMNENANNSWIKMLPLMVRWRGGRNAESVASAIEKAAPEPAKLASAAPKDKKAASTDEA